jgi:hypothetical protein
MYPDGLFALLPRIEGRKTSLDMAAVLHPADAFGHPMNVVDDCDLTSYEKRAILSSWAANACGVPEPTQPGQAAGASSDDILDALRLLESESELEAGQSKGPPGQSGGLPRRARPENPFPVWQASEALFSGSRRVSATAGSL